LNQIILKYNSTLKTEYASTQIINDIEKLELLILIIIQLFRMPKYRQDLLNKFKSIHKKRLNVMIPMVNHIQNTDIKPEDVKINYEDKYENILHASFLLDAEFIEEYARVINDKIWIFGINETNLPFYTSDNPIVGRYHIKNTPYYYNGLGAKGVEIIFPISPKIILVLFDKEYFKDNELNDNKFVLLSNYKIIRYNGWQYINASNHIVSSTDNFRLLTDISKMH